MADAFAGHKRCLLYSLPSTDLSLIYSVRKRLGLQYPIVYAQHSFSVLGKALAREVMRDVLALLCFLEHVLVLG